MTTLTVNYADTHFSVSSAGGGGTYPKALFEPHVDFQSVFVRNTTNISQVPFMVLANTGTSYYQNTIIVDGVEYAIDYTDENTIAGSLEAMYSILASAFSGQENVGANRFEFTAAPSLEDFSTSLGINLIFPKRVGNVITFWNTGYVVPAKAFDNSDLISVKTRATDIEDSGFANNASLVGVIANDAITIQGRGLRSCFVLADASFASAKNLQDYAMSGCSSVEEFVLPAIEIIGDTVFQNCTSATTFTFGPNLIRLGSTTGDNSIFSEITGNTITVTIPVYFQTNDGGSMAGDLVYLDSNNTVTFNWI